MPDLAILPGAGQVPVFASVEDPADRLSWLEPPPAALPAGAVPYRALLRFGAADPVTPFLYIVEQDADPAEEAELNAWYAQEHMPRLAGVPGVVAARRYAALDPAQSPRYLAAYWLERREAFESPAWIEARVTPWTARARTFFRNPRRIMRRLEDTP
ncbi:hypothetical protein [Roseomonas chloroacetimidivorans]|uniref:hypothetical protein n=1 Tax=Roseomonas chloroacetimidivorans TaxID=1766656 RepID=UPI003C71CB08